MKGQVFTIAKINYMNGIVYLVAEKDHTDIITLAKHARDTIKSGDAKYPQIRVRTLTRFAEGLGLVKLWPNGDVWINETGRQYYNARADNKWSLSERQKIILREQILSNPSKTPTIHAITSLLHLVEKGYTGEALAHQYSSEIGKDQAWRSDVTYDGFTQFGLSYLRELGFIDTENKIRTLKKDISQDSVLPRSRKTLLFTWNPNKWEWLDLPIAIYELYVEGKYLGRWSCGATRDIMPGDRAFLMRLGIHPKGIIGSGFVVSQPFESPHYNPGKAQQGEKVHRVRIMFDVLSDIPILSQAVLSSDSLREHNWFPQASGTHIPDSIAAQLEIIWSKATGVEFLPPNPYDLLSQHTEGGARNRNVTLYERNPKAREDCIRHHGTTCSVCGLNFEDQYGVIGKGFIHVHHLKSISEIKQEYIIDPINDLRPVCPNCHAMLHKRIPTYSIDELKNILTFKS